MHTHTHNFTLIEKLLCSNLSKLSLQRKNTQDIRRLRFKGTSAGNKEQSLIFVYAAEYIGKDHGALVKLDFDLSSKISS